MSQNKSPRNLRPATRLVHGGTLRSQFGEMSEAMYLTQGYAYESMESAERRFKGDEPGFMYSRFSNPTVAMFEQRMALLEGAESARATATDLEQWRAAVRPNTKTFFLESPTNPQLEIIDIAAVAKIAHDAGATLVVDNVFATPILQSPLQLGADCVVYSATKHVDGQGRVLGGCILASEAFIQAHIHNFLRQTGPAISPFNAWVMLKSLETLPLRVTQQMRNAERVADFLAEQSAINYVLYPSRKDHPQHELAMRQMSGGGTVVVIDVKGGKQAAFRMANAFSIIKISNNLGDAKSIVTHPATTTHQRLPQADREAMGIGEGMLRLSIGLEDIEDILEDFQAGIDAI